MTLRKVLSVMAIVMVSFMALVSLAGCSNEINESAGSAAVCFTTSVSKALNQSGLVNSDVEDKVESYYWMYYVGLDEPAKNDDGNFNDMDWQKFSDKSEAKGLGTIPGLMKGESYYFGLRGYKSMNETSKDFEDLIWEGFHYTDGTTASINAVNFEKVKLVSKNQLVTVDVYTAGVGRLYFCISAPAVAGFSTTGSYVVNNKVQYDYFTYNIKSLDTTEIITSDTNLYIENTYTSDTDVKCYKESDQTFYYSDLLEDGNTSVPTGTYLMTIWQNSYDTESKTYKAVSQRKQVLLINILSGVNTIVSGSLDSTALDTFNYEANGWTEANKQHMNVIFHKGEADDVETLAVTVTDSDGTSVSYTSPSDIIEVADGDYIKIDWSEDSNLVTKISVNGDYLNLEPTTSTDLRTEWGKEFYLRTTKPSKNAYVAKTGSDIDNHYVLCYGKEDLDYIVTIEQVNASDGKVGKSISFTIQGTEAEDVTLADVFKENSVLEMTLHSEESGIGEYDIYLKFNTESSGTFTLKQVVNCNVDRTTDTDFTEEISVVKDSDKFIFGMGGAHLTVDTSTKEFVRDLGLTEQEMYLTSLKVNGTELFSTLTEKAVIYTSIDGKCSAVSDNPELVNQSGTTTLVFTADEGEFRTASVVGGAEIASENGWVKDNSSLKWTLTLDNPTGHSVVIYVTRAS